MGETTGISWCDRTWSPWIGCTKVSPACDGCYAANLMHTRLGRVEWGPHGERTRTSAAYWRQLEKWDREAAAAGRRISVFPSLCDPFDNAADPGVRREWFALMRATPNLTHLLLTKRPQNAIAMSEAAGGLPPNAALGTTVEDQKRADINVPALLAAKAMLKPAFAFLSCEPLLGPVDLTRIPVPRGDAHWDTLTGKRWNESGPLWGFERLDWIITGGETDQGQHKARPSNPDWFRSIRDQCHRASVPYHHKQNGIWAPADAIGIVSDGPVTDRWGNVRDWMSRYVVADGNTWAARVRGHSFTEHATDLVYRVGKRAAGRLLDGVEHNGMPEARR